MQDFKLELTREIDKTYRDVQTPITNDKVKGVAKSFVQNMDRVLALAAFPLGLFNLRWMEIREVGVSPTPSGTTVARPGGTTFGYLPPPDASRFAEVVNFLVARGLIENADLVDNGVEAILSAMITGTWTAFETMAGDMWEVSVNENPEPILSQLAKQEFENGQPVERVRLPLSVDEFKQSGYSLRGQFGTIIRRDTKSGIGFDRFERIADAYRKAFGHSFGSLDTDQDRSLFSLAHTRNVIVHKAGIVDQPFLNSMVAINHPIQQFAGLQKGDRIPVNGELVKTLLDDSIRSSITLIAEVDRELASARGACGVVT